MREKKKNRNIRRKVQFNEDEYKVLLEKSKNYSSQSAMIRDAIKVFNDKSAIKKLDTLNQLDKKMDEYHRELSAIGNNINQLAHYANQLQKIGEYSDSFFNDILDEIRTVEELIGKSINNDIQIFKYIIK